MHIWPNAYKDVNTPFARQMAVNGDFKFHWAKDDERGNISGLDFESDGIKLTYKELKDTPDVILLQLSKPLATSESIVIRTPFKVKIPKLFSRLGRIDNFYSITQWYPKPAVYDVNGWNYMPYLNQGEFYSEFGDFKVTIRVPDNYKVAATGNLLSDTLIEGKGNTVVYSESNVHDFAWFASSSFASYKSEAILKTGDTVSLELFCDQNQGKDNGVFNDMELTLDHYSQKIGNYPYKTCKVVLGPLEAGAGMEYPTITICQAKYTKAVMHEVGHNWFYGMLGSNERMYPWMDESINSYFDNEVEAMTALLSKSDIRQDETFYTSDDRSSQFDHYQQKILRYRKAIGLDQAINLSSSEYNEENYGNIIYIKGKFAFAYLKQTLGEDMFYNCFNAYFSEWKYRHPLPGDMQRSFEKTSGMNLDWFFKDVLSDVNSIDYKLCGSKYKFYGPDSMKRHMESMVASGQKINPYGFLMERSIYNNGHKKQFLKLGFPMGMPRYSKQLQVNIMPFAGYNIYDGLYPLLYINNSLLNDRAFEYQLIPAYSIKEKRFIGYGKLSWRRPNRQSMGLLDIGLQGQSFGLDEIGESLRYYKVRPYLSYTWHGGLSGRNKVMSNLTISMTHTGLERSSFLGYVDTLGNPHHYNFSADLFYNYYNIRFNQDWRWQLNRVRMSHNAEYGTNHRFNPGSNAYLKLWTDIEYSLILKKNKKFKSRFFGGYFPYKRGVFNDQKFYISGNSGNQDYNYSEAMIGRNENFSSDLLIGRQIINRGGLRQILGLQGSSDWMFTLSNDVDFPGKLPLGIYFDLGYYRYQNIVNVVGGQRVETKMELVYTGGIQLNLIKNVIQIFVPIINSEQFKQYNQINNSFINSIGFKLNLNGLEPSRAINGVATSGKLIIGE